VAKVLVSAFMLQCNAGLFNSGKGATHEKYRSPHHAPYQPLF